MTQLSDRGVTGLVGEGLDSGAGRVAGTLVQMMMSRAHRNDTWSAATTDHKGPRKAGQTSYLQG